MEREAEDWCSVDSGGLRSRHSCIGEGQVVRAILHHKERRWDRAWLVDLQKHRRESQRAHSNKDLGGRRPNLDRFLGLLAIKFKRLGGPQKPQGSCHVGGYFVS